MIVAYFLQNSANKYLRRSGQQAEISKANAWRVTKLLKFFHYKVNVVHQFKLIDYDKRVQFCNWFNTHVHDGILDLQLTFFTDEM